MAVEEVDVDATDGPGPGNVQLPSVTGYVHHALTKPRNPAFSIGMKLDGTEKHAGPGPVYMLPTGSSRKGIDISPRYSMAVRYKTPKRQLVPGPGAYKPGEVLNHKKAPRYSFGIKPIYAEKNPNPAPNGYTLPPLISRRTQQVKSEPSYSMMGMNKHGGIMDNQNEHPGPGTYSYKYSASHNKAVSHSLAARVFPPTDGTQKPAPNAYMPQTGHRTKKPPSYSFGIRPKGKIRPMITQEDMV